MTYHKILDSRFLINPTLALTINISRIEQTLLARLPSTRPEVGRILKVWDNGFILIDDHNRPIYFFDNMPLHVPFGVALECSREELAALASLCQGSRLYKHGNMLRLDFAGSIRINLDSGIPVDLLYVNQGESFSYQLRSAIIQTLSGVVASHGDSRGLSGVLTWLPSFYPKIMSTLDVPVSPYARYAMGSVNSLLGASSKDLTAALMKACRSLIGCGPGLTPSGDDFLIGFLAAHFLGDSGLAWQVRQEKMSADITALAKVQTTLVSAELLAYAVQGRFSEILYQAWHALPNLHTDSSPNRPVNYLLNWGSSSGTDTIVGLIIGIATCNKENGVRL